MAWGETRRQKRVTAWMVAGLAGAVVLALAVPRLLAGRSSVTSHAYGQAVVTSGITVTATLSATPADPFAGTPADAFPAGAAGIALPKPLAVDGFRPTEVAADLQRVRKALIAGRLDDMMLTGHDPARLIALLAPGQRATATAWFKDAAFTGIATWIDPAVKLDPREQPRVSGRVTYASVRAGGRLTLRVTTNFVWVYAFAGPDHPVAAVHDEVSWDFPPTGMWVGTTRSYLAWTDCAAAERGLLAPVRVEGLDRPTGPAELLRPDHGMDVAKRC
ncbi:hypothetical protein [Actinoplanes subtropicus]|uniref:hypothetical protein n=1 Tax=Actinoplanes subtropicus TaxID=543632 RepID=UPI0012FC406A|nr:hypothetical protein [Actinoplanes subtropicus]